MSASTSRRSAPEPPARGREVTRVPRLWLLALRALLVLLGLGAGSLALSLALGVSPASASGPLTEACSAGGDVTITGNEAGPTTVSFTTVASTPTLKIDGTTYSGCAGSVTEVDTTALTEEVDFTTDGTAVVFASDAASSPASTLSVSGSSASAVDPTGLGAAGFGSVSWSGVEGAVSNSDASAKLALSGLGGSSATVSASGGTVTTVLTVGANNQHFTGFTNVDATGYTGTSVAFSSDDSVAVSYTGTGSNTSTMAVSGASAFSVTPSAIGAASFGAGSSYTNIEGAVSNSDASAKLALSGLGGSSATVSASGGTVTTVLTVGANNQHFTGFTNVDATGYTGTSVAFSSDDSVAVSYTGTGSNTSTMAVSGASAFSVTPSAIGAASFGAGSSYTNIEGAVSNSDASAKLALSGLGGSSATVSASGGTVTTVLTVGANNQHFTGFTNVDATGYTGTSVAFSSDDSVAVSYTGTGSNTSTMAVSGASAFSVTPSAIGAASFGAGSSYTNIEGAVSNSDASAKLALSGLGGSSATVSASGGTVTTVLTVGANNQHFTGFTNVDATGYTGTSVAFSSDDSVAVSYTGTGSNTSTMAVSGASAFSVTPSAIGAASFGAGSSYTNIEGAVSNSDASAKLALSGLGGSSATVSASGGTVTTVLTVGANNQHFTGFTNVDATGYTGTSVAFSSDDSVAVSYTGTGSNTSTMAVSGASAFSVTPSAIGAASFGAGSSYTNIEGAVSNSDASAKLALSGLGGSSATVSASGGTVTTVLTVGANNQHFTGFTNVDATGYTGTSVAFSSDDSVAVSYTGTGSNTSTMAVSGASAFSVTPSAIGAASFGAGSSYTNIEGAVSNSDASAKLALSGLGGSSATVSASGGTVTTVLTVGANNQHFTGFTNVDATGYTGTSVAFSSDDSVAVSYTGTGSNTSTMAVSGASAFSVTPSAIGAASFGAGSSYTNIEGAVSNSDASAKLALSGLGGSSATVSASGGTVTTVLTVGANNQHFTGFTNVDATGYTGTSVAFSSDDSVAVSYTGTGSNTSTMAVSGASAFSVTPSAIGAASFGAGSSYTNIEGAVSNSDASAKLALSGLGGSSATVSASGGTVTTVLTVGANNQHFTGFTNVDATGYTGTSVAFSSDDSVAVSYTGTGSNTSSLTFTATVTMTLTALGAGSFGAGTSFAGIDGTLSGTNASIAVLPSSGTPALSTTASVTTFTPSGSAPTQQLSGFGTYDAGGSATTSFTTDGTAAGAAAVTYNGNSASTLTLTGSNSLSSSGSSGTYGVVTFNNMTHVVAAGNIALSLSGSHTSVAVLVSAGTVTATVTDGGSSNVYTGYATIDASGVAPATPVTFSTDGTAATTFTGNGANSTLTLTGASAIPVTSSGIGSGSFVGSAGKSTYSGITGSVTNNVHSSLAFAAGIAGGSATVAVDAGSQTTTLTVGANSQAFSGFAVVDCSKLPGAVQFSSDGTAATLTGNGASSTLTFTGATALTVTSTGIGAGNFGAGTSYANIGGAVTSNANATSLVFGAGIANSSAAVTVDSTAAATQTVLTVGANTQDFDTFRTVDCSHIANGVTFSSDGSTPASLTGNGASSALTFTGATALTVTSTGIGAGNFGAGASYANIGGAVTSNANATSLVFGAGIANSSAAVTVDSTAAATQTVLTVGANTQDFDTFRTVDCSHIANGVTFSSDGSTPASLTGNGASSSLTFTATVTMTLTALGAGSFGAGTSFAGIDGTLSGTNASIAVLPSSGTPALSTTASVTTFTPSGSAPTQQLSGFGTYDAGGSATTSFTTDGTAAGAAAVTYNGNSASTLTMTGSAHFSTTAAGGIYGVVTFDNMGGGVVAGAGSTISLTLGGSPTSVSTVVSGGAVQTIVTTGGSSTTYKGYTSVDASQLGAGVPVSFSTDGSAPAVLTGNGSSSTLTITGSTTLTLTGYGQGSVGAGANPTTFSAVDGAISGPAGATLDLAAGIKSVSVAVTASASTSVTAAGGTQVVAGIAVVDAAAMTGPVVVSTQGIAPITVTGDGSPTTLDLSHAATLGPVTVDLATQTVTGLIADPTIAEVGNVVGTSGTFTVDASPTTPGYLQGGSGVNTFVLVPADDVVIDGAGTKDTIDLSQANAAVSLDLADPNAQNTGGDGVVTVVPGTVGYVIGSTSGSTIIGGATGGTLVGQAGQGSDTDYLEGGSGSTTFDAAGASGSEVLVGGSGTNTFQGGSHINYFAPGPGDLAAISSQPGATNWLDFASAPATVDINLSGVSVTFASIDGNGSVSVAPGILGGWLPRGSAAEQNFGIDNIIGTSYGDHIVADSNNDQITSGGSAVILPGTGNDTITCTAGSDCTVDYVNLGPPQPQPGGSQTLQGITFDNNTVTKWVYGGADTLSGVSVIVATQWGNDALYASAANQTLVGLGGNDLLVASSTYGYDTLIGGNGPGVQTFVAGTSQLSDGYYQGVGHNTMIGGTTSDYFFAEMANTSTTPYQLIDGYNTIIAGGNHDVIEADPTDSVSGPDNSPLSGDTTFDYEVLTGFAQNNQPLTTDPLGN